MKLQVNLAMLLLLATSVVTCKGWLKSSESNTLLEAINKLVDTVLRLQQQMPQSEEHDQLSRMSEKIQEFRFRLINGRIFEKSPREFIEKLDTELRKTLPHKFKSEFDATLKSLLSKDFSAWEGSKSDAASEPDGCSSSHKIFVHEIALDDFSTKCSKGSEWLDVLGCVGAATLYCHKILPLKASSELVGLVTNRKKNVLTVACVDQGSFVFTPHFDQLTQHCRGGCEQRGGDRVCEMHHGSEYTGIFAERVSMKPLGENVENDFMVPCFPVAKRVHVKFSTLRSEDTRECRARNPDREYACLKAASTYCNANYNYTGGIVQYSLNDETAVVACYNAIYTGDVHISRDGDFHRAKNIFAKFCSLDFDIDKGKILAATPEAIHTGTYDNRKSSVELHDTFSVSKTVAWENSFSHSHGMTIGAELTTKVKIPFIGESKITVSASYTASVSLTKTNRKEDTFTHTSVVVVPPFKAIVKKAVITRTNMDVPWRAVGLNGLGQRVEISGTWVGVDVSTIAVKQEDLGK